MRIEFYDEYFAIPSFDTEKKAHAFKDVYIRLKLENNSLYKFVAFNDDESLNQKKLKMLQQKQFWASRYDLFKDKREMIRPYKCFEVTRRTGKNMRYLINFFSTVNEMNDITCFTYRASEFMWNEYANNGNGYYLEFDMFDSEKFYPVIYLDKSKIDYTNDIIHSFTSEAFQDKYIKKLAILPWVLKDLVFQEEKEVRFLYGDLYDETEGLMGGRIAPGKKKAMGYNGIECSFDYAGISLKKVVIGSNCRKAREVEQICVELGVICDRISH